METNNKLREALVSVKKSIDDMGAASLNGDPEVLLMSLTQVCARLSARIEAALAEPVKNCEVGTAEEQCRRFRKYCGCRCLTKCKVYEKGIALGIVNYNNYYKTGCHFIWAQLPYEEGGDK